MPSRSFELDDPLSLAIAPPADETPTERLKREAEEAEARRISEAIDEQLKQEKENERGVKRPVKLLLLGQSESGKTATLKNFQLTYARREWTQQRNAWRAVIFLNLVRNVNGILEALSHEMSADSDGSDDSSEESYPTLPSSKRAEPPLKFKQKHRILQQRLVPLSRLQDDLERRLGVASKEPLSTPVTVAAPFGDSTKEQRQHRKEFSINSTNGWKSALEKFWRVNRGEMNPMVTQQLKEEDGAISRVIELLRGDMKDLWEDPAVRQMLNRRKMRIEDSPGFFLNDVDRIAHQQYQPSDDDVIRARLRTLGVQEYRFVFEHGHTVGQEWRLYDVGGTRSNRLAWYPYFEDVDAIIFLAPISCFDEKLAEDRRVNRLEDSYLLWRSVCSCKALENTQIILFLNKCDLLQNKLQRGVRIVDSVPSYGSRKNDLETATKYFQQHFKEILKQCSSRERNFYVHLTSVIDTRSTAATLGVVEESILRNHLRRADLM